MNKETAWFLGYLLSDGCICRPAYREKGDETHLSFSCKYDDREILFKIKNILNTRAIVKDYPTYKSPNSKLRVYDRKDIIDRYSDIKTKIPEDIKGFERHFVRGLIDGDGCLYYRESRKSLVVTYINEYEDIVNGVQKIICEALNLPVKPIRHIEQHHIWSIGWEGNIAKLIAWWLYHGDIENCCLQRKLEKYRQCCLDSNVFANYDDEIIYAVNAYQDNGEIIFRTPNTRSLEWCKRLQSLLTVETTPVYHNKGQKKYYRLYIHNRNTNTQSVI